MSTNARMLLVCFVSNIRDWYKVEDGSSENTLNLL